MADKKISELTALTGADTANDDQLVIVDTSAGLTKNITMSEFKNALDTATGFVRITGDTMTGALDVQSTITSDGLTVDKAGSPSGKFSGNGGSGEFALEIGQLGTNGSAGLNSTSFNGTSAAMKFQIDGTERMRIDSSGNVGIGTSSPVGKLSIEVDNATVYSSTNMFGSGISQYIFNTSATDGTAATLGFGVDGTSTDAQAAISTIYTSAGNGALAFGTRGGSNVIERMRIDSSGRVGIGTSSPSEKLHITSTSGDIVRFQANVGSGVGYLYSDSGGAGIYSGTALNNAGIYLMPNSRMDFRVNGSERMRIDSSGNVGIGTSSPTNGKLEVTHASSTVPAGFFRNTSGSGDSPSLTVQGGANNAAPNFSVLDYNGTTDFVVQGTGNVGIGTSSPSRKLQITGDRDAILRFENTRTIESGDQILGSLEFYSNDESGTGANVRSRINAFTSVGGNSSYLTFSTADGTTDDVERMRIDSSGRVGIGTSSPSVRLDVEDASAYAARIGSSSYYWELGSVSGSSPRLNAVGTGASSTFLINDTERMRIDSSGDVMVGKTTSDNTNAGIKLDSSGYASFVIANDYPIIANRLSSDGDIAVFRKDGSTVGSIGTRNGDLTIGTGGVGLQFEDSTNTIDPVSLTTNVKTDGVVNLGESSARFKDLYLSGAMFGGGVTSSSDTTSRSSGNAFSGTSSYANWTSWGTGTHTHASFRNGTSQVGYIQTNTTSTTYSTSSDYRLKENVVDLTGATDRIKQIPVHRFNFIADPDTTVDGFLAHEVQDIVPEAITGTKDAMRDEEYEVTPAVTDDDGNVITEAIMGTRSVPDYQGIDQSKLVPLLVATIKELEARITALENA